MNALTLMYHDIVDRAEASGFAGAAAGRYKILPSKFDAHLLAIAEITKRKPLRVESRPQSNSTRVRLC